MFKKINKQFIALVMALLIISPAIASAAETTTTSTRPMVNLIKKIVEIKMGENPSFGLEPRLAQLIVKLQAVDVKLKTAKEEIKTKIENWKNRE